MNQRTRRKFALADILNITTGLLFTPVERLYDVANFLSGESLFTHQLPKAFKIYGPVVKRQLKQIAHIAFEEGEVTPENYLEVLADLEAAHGNEFELEARPDLWADETAGVVGDLVEMTDAPQIVVKFEEK